MKKKAQCILLDTKTKGVLRQTTNGLGGQPILSLDKWGNEKHLYFVSDEEPVINDITINTYSSNNTVFKIIKVLNDGYEVQKLGDEKVFYGVGKTLKKIVATTNPELWCDSMLPYGGPCISKIGDDFVEAYIKAYNEGSPITEINLEYEDNGYEVDMEGVGGQDIGWMPKIELKLRSNGTVIISSVNDNLNPNNLKVGEEYWIKYLPCDSMWEHVKITRFTDQGYAWGKGPKHNGIIAQNLYDIIAFDDLLPKVKKMYTRDDMIKSIKEYNSYYTTTQSPVETVDTWFDRNYPQ